MKRCLISNLVSFFYLENQGEGCATSVVGALGDRKEGEQRDAEEELSDRIPVRSQKAHSFEIADVNLSLSAREATENQMYVLWCCEEGQRS